MATLAYQAACKQSEHETHGVMYPREGAGRVLFIEDNFGLSSGMRVLLQQMGYEVHLAHTGLEGLEAARRLQPDVVCCDIGLPEMNGYEVARCLRMGAETRAARLVAITGHGSSACLRQALDAGFDCHLVKPVGIEELRDALRPPCAEAPRSAMTH